MSSVTSVDGGYLDLVIPFDIGAGLECEWTSGLAWTDVFGHGI